MRSPTSLEDSRLVRIVVPCAQTRLPGPRGHRATIFLYSPCPNLEGIKDALSYKFRRLTIGQNCCAVCTNQMHSRARASGASAARFDRPARQATEPRAKREAMSLFVMVWW